MAKNLTTATAKEKKFIKELFDMFDKDGNGTVSVKELKTGLRGTGRNPTKTEIKEIMKEMGIKKGQTVNYVQFEKCMLRYVRDDHKADKSMTQKELNVAFKVFDKDNNNYIDKKELKQVLTSLGEKLKDSDVEDMFQAVDTNADGKIECKEFVNMLTKNMS